MSSDSEGAVKYNDVFIYYATDSLMLICVVEFSDEVQYSMQANLLKFFLKTNHILL